MGRATEAYRSVVELESTRRLRFAADRDRVWAAIGRVSEYPRLWPWLRRFEGTVIEPGAVLRCTIQPPLPYVLRLRITIVEVEQPALVVATIDGDVRGTARLTLEDRGDRCEGELTSTLAPVQPMLRLMANLVPPVARFGHDWVLETGARQFSAKALRRPR